MKITTLVSVVSLATFSTFFQTIKQNVDKAAKDKNTMNRSAKADVIIQKKTITVSSQTSSDAQPLKSKIIKKKYKQRRKYNKKRPAIAGPF